MTTGRAVSQAVILVGGRGTRLGDLTRETPKPMIKVGQWPILEHIVRNLARHGISEVILLAGYLGTQLEAFAASSDHLGARIRCAVEDQPMGTGGALPGARDMLAEHFFLLNGDTFFDINFLALWAGRRDGDLITLALRHVDDAGRYGSTIVKDGRIVEFLEKQKSGGAGLINGGIALMHRDVLSLIPEGACSLEHDVFPRVVRRGLMGGVEFDRFFIDVGTPTDLEAAQTSVPRAMCKPVMLVADSLLHDPETTLEESTERGIRPGAVDAIRRLNDAGWLALVVKREDGPHLGHNALRKLNDALAPTGAHLDDWVEASSSTINTAIADRLEGWSINHGMKYFLVDPSTAELRLPEFIQLSEQSLNAAVAALLSESPVE